VRLNETDKDITLEVTDNGRGISRQDMVNTSSMGLLGMRERATLLGGTFKIGRLRTGGTGTRMTVTIPKQQADTGKNQNHENSLSGRSRGGASRVEADTGR
jgi:glucose-6-phosphate-specific signal transduction histidine kinase